MTENELEKRSAEIFEQLLELPADQRPSAAMAACNGDDELLGRVSALLNALPLAGHFMASHTPGTEETVGSDVTRSSTAWIGEQAGDQIGPYKLLEKIGEGGFGVVFMAQQERPVRRRVALKVIKMGMDTREVVARFEAERQALALMDHPNIAKVFDAGATQTGRPYFVMELVRGSPITKYADTNRMTASQRVALLADVCRAVQHAHSKGVIHRDIKPSNVLVAVSDDKPIPKVIDFGIAKATQSRLTEQTLFTALQQMIGTPQYMSPEQAGNDGTDIDTRSDVYSLGVLLYELLVGTTPLDAQSLRSAAFEAMRQMILKAEPPKPSTRLSALGDTRDAIALARGTDAKQLSRQLSGELDWIVMRALEKDRARRYETAAAMADDLGRYLAGEAVLAGPVSGLYRLKKAARRHRAAFAVSAALATLLVLGITGTTAGLVEARREKRIAIDARGRAVAGEQSAIASAAEADRQRRAAQASEQIAKDKAAEATATLEFFNHDVLAVAAPDRTRDSQVSQVLINSIIQPALQKVELRFDDHPQVRMHVQDTLADTLLHLGHAELAEPPATAALATARKVLGENDPQTLDALGIYAEVVFARGRNAEAAKLFQQVWETGRRVWGEDAQHTLDALSGYANCLASMGRYADAELPARQVWEARRRLLGPDNQETLSSLNNYAVTIWDQGRYADALPLYKQSWEGHRRALGDDHPETLAAMRNYTMAVAVSGHLPEAEQLAKQCWDASRRVMGDNHAATLRALGNYAYIIKAEGRLEEAEKLDEQCWNGYRKGLGEEHPDTLTALFNYAMSIAVEGHDVQAAPLLRQCWMARRRVLGLHHSETYKTLAEYLMALDGAGQDDEAARAGRQGWDDARREWGPDGATTSQMATEFGRALTEVGRNSEADDLLQRVIRRLSDPHGGPVIAQLLVNARQIDRVAQLNLGRCSEDMATAFREEYKASQKRGNNVFMIAFDALSLGRCLAQLGPAHFAEAEARLREAVQIRARRLGAHSPLTVRAAVALAEFLDQTRRAPEAAGVRMTYGVVSTTQPATRPTTSNTATTTQPATQPSADDPVELERLARSAGDTGRTADLLKRAIAGRRRVSPTDDEQIVNDLIRQARACRDSQQFAPALAALQDAAETARRDWGLSDPAMITAATAWADLLKSQGHPEKSTAVRAEYDLDHHPLPAVRPPATTTTATGATTRVSADPTIRPR